MNPRAAIAGLVLALIGAIVSVQVPGEERIPITDPDRLERMGFPRNARNVFVWSKLDRSDPGLSGEKAAASPENWGTQNGFTTIASSNLQETFYDTKLLRGWGLGGNTL